MAVASTNVDSVDDLQLAFHTSDLAADLALAHFESGVSATLKADGTPVTEADRAVERLIRETLAAARPGDALLGEELGQLGASDRVWIIDPIDGTSSFSRRDPNWRVHLALEVAGSIEIAVVTAPALQRRSRDDRDLDAAGHLQREVNPPVRVTTTEGRRAVDRVDDPDPIGCTELSELLAEERIARPRRSQRLANQSLDGPVGFGHRCAVGLQRRRDAGLEVSQREVGRQVRGVERELQVVNAVHVRRRYRQRPAWPPVAG